MTLIFSCVCPVIDHEFCHTIVKVAVDLQGDSQLDPQTNFDPFGKSRRNKSSVVAFFHCNGMHFQRVENMLFKRSFPLRFETLTMFFNGTEMRCKSISKSFQNIVNAFSNIDNAFNEGRLFGIIHRTAAISYENLYNKIVTH